MMTSIGSNRRICHHEGIRMSIRRIVTALAAGVLALGIGAGVAPAASAATKPVIVNCNGKPVTKPAEITIACADGGVMITKITWKEWNANRARGTGTLAWNPCVPTCVASTEQTLPVRITLAGLASAPGQPDVFSEVLLTFPKGGPAGLNSGTYVIDNKLS
jgi:hypothetical protein